MDKIGGYVTRDVGGDVGGYVTTTAPVCRAREYARAATAPATRRGYASDWACYSSWCKSEGVEALPAAPETIGAYLAAKAESLRVATLERRLAAIATAHRLAGHQLDTKHPAIRDVVKGIRRQHGTPQRQAEATTINVLKTMVGTCDGSLIGLRDQAILLIGFGGAMRRSELVALRVEDVALVPEGLRIVIPRSKGDQAGEGQMIGITRTRSAYCPVAALSAWMTAASITEGHVFRAINRHGGVSETLSDRGIAMIIKSRAAAAGLDPQRFSGHSLRAGLATSAAAAGIEERDIQRQTRHKSVITLRKYIRNGELFVDNVSGKIGL